jgi:hypothetical protein
MIEGACFCGAVRYGIDDHPYRAVNCHCTMCRRVHAAPYVTWLVVPANRFRYLRTDGLAPLQSSAAGTRYHCTRCGTHVACVNSGHPDIVDVALGSLDDPARFTASFEVFTDTRLPGVAAIAQDSSTHA